ncbi:MAG: hypothetical protein J7J07_08720 [Syntrophobacterales bacterium]|nr:hypothetical protein [Syntrophobacterales bacterium]
MKEFADKLVECVEKHPEEISKRFCKAVRTNPRTPSYHSMSPDACFLHAMDFYKNLERIYFSEPLREACDSFFDQYAGERHKEGIPLSEAAYAICMMRRHIWLYADSQALFITPIDYHRAIATINKTILIFDHGLHCMIQKYVELSKK